MLAGASLRLVATVSGSEGRPTDGAVVILDGELTLGTAPLKSGRAVLTVRLFSSGRHDLRAAYQGAPPSQGACVVTVLEPASVLLVAATDGSGLTLTARVHGRWDAPPCTGSILFECDGMPLGSGEIDAGQASISRVLSPGAHSLVAVYAGDERYGGVRSERLEISSVPASEGSEA